MVALSNQSILVLASEAEHATELVRVLENVGSDIVIAANAREALQRLDQFRFDAGVIDCSLGAEKVVDRLRVLGVPFCVCGGTPPNLETVEGGEYRQRSTGVGNAAGELDNKNSEEVARFRPSAGVGVTGTTGAMPQMRTATLQRGSRPVCANSRHPRHCFPLMPPSFLHSGWTPRSHARDPARDVGTESLVLSSKRLLKRGLFVRHDE